MMIWNVTSAGGMLRCRRQRLAVFQWLVLGLLVFIIAPRACASSTNSPTGWPTLAELTQKWANTPMDEIGQKADQGDLTAEHFLGFCYTTAFRVSSNAVLGISYYERAARSGYLPSWNNLGILYQYGYGTNSDPVKAVNYYHLAAVGGLATAQANLGYCYRDGLGVEHDSSEALRWWRLAAAQGFSTAMVEIGRAYRFGNGVGRDLETAENWFQKAVDKVDVLGQVNLAILYYDEEHQPGRAVPLFRAAAEAGNTCAMRYLYCYYWGGPGVTTDKSAAMKWLLKSEESGDPDDLCYVGEQFEDPMWVQKDGKLINLLPQNLPEALNRYERAAEKGYWLGQYRLGLCYLQGRGVEQDEERGLELIRKAADQGPETAKFELIGLYSQGIGEPRNEADRPIAMLEQMVQDRSHEDENNHELPYESLVYRYIYGTGTDADLYTAVQWYCREALKGGWASLLGDVAARIRLQGGLSGSSSTQASGTRYLGWERVDLNNIKPFLACLTNYVNAVVSRDHAGLVIIGQKYFDGQGAPHNPQKAWLWFSLAAAKGAPGAAAKVAESEKQLTAKELEDAKAQLPAMIRDFDGVAAELANHRTDGKGAEP